LRQALGAQAPAQFEPDFLFACEAEVEHGV
jgi:hypothetical protein